MCLERWSDEETLELPNTIPIVYFHEENEDDMQRFMHGLR